MTVNELKKGIHNAVDEIEDADHLKALFDFARLPFRWDNELFTNEELKMLNERSEKYHCGEAILIPWQESIANTKQKYGL